MKKFHFSFICLVLVIFTTNCTYAQSRYQGNSTIQLLYGADIDNRDAHLTTITLEHAGAYKAVEHFGFADLFYASEDNLSNVYMEWYPKVSLTAITDGKLKFGPLSDILLGGGINALALDIPDFFVVLAGPVWQFDITGFNLFQLETYLYKHLDHALSYQITYAWDALIPISKKLKIRARGFFDYIAPYSDYEKQFITQPQLLLDAGSLWGSADKLFIGTEWRHWHNFQGEEGAIESIPQLNLLVQF